MYYDRVGEELYFCDPGARRIGIADRRGVPTYSFGSEETLNSPARVVVDHDGRILVADLGHGGVRVFDYDGSVLPDLDLAVLPQAERSPRINALGLAEDGTIYLVDAANRRIVALDGDGKYAGTITPPSDRTDLLVSPADLDVGPSGELVVSDSKGVAVQVYDPRGGFLRGWGAHAVGASDFSLPAGLAVDGKGRIYVADTLRQDIKVFSSDGRFLTNFGGFGVGRGQVIYPVDVASDRKDRLFVSEKGGRRIQVFQVSPADAGGAK